MSHPNVPSPQVIHLAGGCFWGLEHLMSAIPGVLEATSGYANGSGEADANYEAVCAGKTGFRETVRVDYDPAQVTLDALLMAYFSVIDPGQRNAQGPDIGSQYQAGVYYSDDDARQTVERIAALEQARHARFFVEIKPLQNFFPAEEYHQRYLDKNPGGYCHIPRAAIKRLSQMTVDPGRYPRPDPETLRQRLSEEQYRVTQQSGTEPPGSHPFWQERRRGIYVDIVTGEPLFSSTDKYQSGCGWPAFSAPIEPMTVRERDDDSHAMHRTEVRSRAGDSHLGHVFQNDPESPNGTRYCINGAALRFVPYEEMEGEGYGYLMARV